MKRLSRAAALLLAALLIVPAFGGTASAQSSEISQVVCVASGRVTVPGPLPGGALGIRQREPISVEGKGTCIKVSTHEDEFPGFIFGVEFTGEGFSTRTGSCFVGVIWRQDILVDLTFTRLQVPLDVRTARQLWTTELSTDITGPTFEDPILQVPSIYPPTHFQIRDPEVRGNLRGAGAYVEQINRPLTCPQNTAPQNRFLPALFAFTFTGGDIAGP